MKLWKTIDVADNQRALLFRRGRYQSLLMPGRHRINLFGGNVAVEHYDATELVMSRPNIKYLLREYASLAEHLAHYETGDREVALVYRDGKLAELLGPASALTLWKGIDAMRVESIDIDAEAAVAPHLVALLGKGLPMRLLRKAQELLHYVEVPDRHLGLLQVNGKLEKMLEPGSYAFWKHGRNLSVKLVDLRLQAMEVNGQEILTRDRVSLRVNLSAGYRVVDTRTAVETLSDYSAHIYRVLQLALREAVGTRPLDTLLENKDALNSEIRQAVAGGLQASGIELVDVGVKDIILPGEMKLILNRVVEAEKEAEANLIRRREETQAMRALHNTAKMMDNNPTLVRLKELEALERVTGKIDRISVYGGLDGLMNELVKLRGVGS
ncbi:MULTISPECIES: slipin family protein [unclassified Microbulbifer]|uniref:slipin family protein n=1 Tax=unclassified Microbulbifer TaxID=2619833 RepID=UPI0027E5A70D|nr:MULTISPECIES: slipin family protein [unclassified Microbulbifer]